MRFALNSNATSIPRSAILDLGYWIAKKIYSSHVFRDIPRSIRRFLGGRKILIVGGGEIGTEIGIVAYNRGWKVRAIVFQDPARRKSSEQTPSPIRRLPWYIEPRLSQSIDFSSTCEQPMEEEPFLFTHLPELKNLDALQKCILNEMPDIVLLEDMFLGAKEWEDLYIRTQIVLKEKQISKRIIFLPSPEEQDACEDEICSDIFLSKVHMKKFLTKIQLADRMLGKENDVILIDKLKKELDYKEKKEQWKRIDDAVRNHGKVILKPESTSSGHGQLVISDSSALKRKDIERSEAYQDLRTRTNRYVLEKYVENRTEACLIVAKVAKGKSACINRIYYKKYDVDKPLPPRLQGMTRLAYSETKKGQDNDLWLEMDDIATTIHARLAVPFLYIEFIIDNDAFERKQGKYIFINEISYRPDDAGFVTQISHEKNQFDLFMDSLDNLLDNPERKKSLAKPSFIKLKDEYVSRTMVPKKPIQFIPARLFFDCMWVRKEKQLKLRLYEKFLGTGGREVDYGRIIGYMFHHKSRTREQAIELLRSYEGAIGLTKETIDLLIEALPEME